MEQHPHVITETKNMLYKETYYHDRECVTNQVW